MKNSILAYVAFILSTLFNLASALFLLYQIQGFWVISIHAFTGIYLLLNIICLVVLPKGRSFLLKTFRPIFVFERNNASSSNRTLLFKSVHGLFFALLTVQYFSGFLLATNLLASPFILTIHRILTPPTLLLALCHLFIEIFATQPHRLICKATTH